MRLVDGSGPHEGRLEVCVNEAWGTVCSNGWDNTDSKVVCNQLGYLSFGTVYAFYSGFNRLFDYLIGGRYKNFGSGTDRPILMSSLQCRGSERSLLECRQQACSVTSCTHNSDVGVVCESKDLFLQLL